MVRAGEKLSQARIEKGISLEEVSKKTKIKENFLEDIEKGEYQKLPSVSYAHGFVRSYARFLGLNEEELMAIFRREFDEEKAYKVLPKGFESEEFAVSKFRATRGFYVIALILTAFILYLLFQYRYAFLNPSLTINSPKDSSTISSSFVKVAGKTDPNAIVYVNKDLVSVDQSGNFTKIISVFPGAVTIDIKVVNKFQKQTEKKVQIVVK